jgi:unsaturated rhamnogalacturonyl hydrolase
MYFIVYHTAENNFIMKKKQRHQNWHLTLKLMLFTGLFMHSIALFAQQSLTDTQIVLNVANRLLNETRYEFFDSETGRVVRNLTNENFSSNLQHASRNNNWTYTSNIVNLALLKLSETLEDEDLKKHPLKYYEFAFQNAPIFAKNFRGTTRMDKILYPYGHFFITKELDDCGVPGAGLIEINRIDPRKEYQDYINMAADYISNKQDRLSDGTFARPFPQNMTIWGDDLYMSLAFLSRMGKYSGENKYFDDAILQVKNFHKYLFNPANGLYFHAWFDDLQVNQIAHWGRNSGWIMMAKVELLDHLPSDYPERAEITHLLQKQVAWLFSYQDTSGLWRQLIDKNDSYLETSSTAMFIYSITKAVNEGWLDERYIFPALEAWEGLKEYISHDGSVSNICPGLSIGRSITRYYTRYPVTNDLHGIGPVLLAGNEILRWKKGRE